MKDGIDWLEVSRVLDALYQATDRLEQLFPGRRFTPDGHLVGSIGEVVAAYNGFRRLADSPDLQSFLRPPSAPFRHASHPNGPIYSSGRFWRQPE